MGVDERAVRLALQCGRLRLQLQQAHADLDAACKILARDRGITYDDAVLMVTEMVSARTPVGVVGFG